MTALLYCMGCMGGCFLGDECGEVLGEWRLAMMRKDGTDQDGVTRWRGFECKLGVGGEWGRGGV